MRINGNNLGEVDLPRMVAMERLLCRPGGATIEQLAKSLDVNPKTIRRDMDVLRRLYGARRLEVTTGQHGRKTYHVEPGERIFAPWVSSRVKCLK